MARPAVAVGLLALVVLSGCLAADPAGDAPAETPSQQPYQPQDAPHRTYEKYENPWGVQRIEVVVEDAAGMERNIAPQVMKTLSYWEAKTGQNSPYDPEYRLVDSTDSPEIRVKIVQTVDACGVHTDDVALGCAPVIPANATLNGTVTVRVRAGHTPRMTRIILKHEFGHTLGYRHGEGPWPVMSSALSARSPDSIVDADDRSYPWASDTLQVAVVPDAEMSQARRTRIRQAFEYYEDGADGTVPNPPDFTFVSNPKQADVVVALRKSVGSCDVVGPDESCVHWQGPDVDEDPVPEYYTRARIVIGKAGHDRPGWHFGYWIGHSLWTRGVPEPFQFGEHPPANTW